MHKLGFWAGVFLLVNAMIGAGVIINTPLFGNVAQESSFIFYIFALVVLLPIVWVFANLAASNSQAGGLLLRIKADSGVVVGFWATWSYYLAKCSSAAVICLSVATTLATVFSLPVLQTTFCLIFGISLAISCGLSLTRVAPTLFFFCKTIPLFSLIGLFLVFFGQHFFTLAAWGKLPVVVNNLSSCLPMALFSLSSFEIIFHLGHSIDQPEKYAKKILLTGFMLAWLLVVVFQFGVLQALPGQVLQANYISCLPAALGLEHPFFGFLLLGVITMSIFISAMSILGANAWNLFALAKEDLLPLQSILTLQSVGNAPWVCLFITSTLAFLAVVVCENFIALQSISVLATALTYTLTCFGAWRMSSNWPAKALATLALLSCATILFFASKRVIATGLSAEFLYAMGIGLGLFAVQCWRNKNE